MLKGAYGWFQKVGLSSVFIRQTVYGCDIADGAKVLTYGAYTDPDDADGSQEAYYCVVDYKKGQESANQSQIYVKTLDTPGTIDLAYSLNDLWSSISPDDWCKDEEFCKRQTADQWTRVLTEPKTNFPFDNQDDEKSAVSCSVWRSSKTPNNVLEIKNGTPYRVSTGYKIYNTGANLTNGAPDFEGKGVVVEMTFEAASYLLAGATFVASLLAF